MNMTRAAKVRWLTCCVLGAAVLAWVSAPALLVSCIRNDQVNWSGQFGMLIPGVDGGVLPRLILWRGRDCVPHLRYALRDESRFVAAHVYLTWFFKDPMNSGTASYNGLHFNYEADGRRVIPSDQRARLIQQWADR